MTISQYSDDLQYVLLTGSYHNFSQTVGQILNLFLGFGKYSGVDISMALMVNLILLFQVCETDNTGALRGFRVHPCLLLTQNIGRCLPSP